MDTNAFSRRIAWSAAALTFLAMAPISSSKASASPPASGTTTRVSLTAAGGQGNGNSGAGAVSANGRYVVFSSSASNLVAGDTNGQPDVFIRDRQAGTTMRVSVRTGGTQANGESGGEDVSADGRFVVFSSAAANLVAGDTNNKADVFVRDRALGTTTRVSVGSGGAQASGDSGYSSLYGFSTRISGNGRYVVFRSDAPNLVAGDTNGEPDVFVHDMVTGSTVRVNVASDGTQARGDDVGSFLAGTSITGDGRYVAFSSVAPNLVAGDANGVRDVFVHDQTTGATTRVSTSTDGTEENGYGGSPSISGDGRFVAFDSTATNLVSGDTNDEADVFVKDRETGTTSRVSVTTGGTQATSDNGEGSGGPSISANGRYVAFGSRAFNLVSGDTNGEGDVFVHDRSTYATTRISVSTSGIGGEESSYGGSISADGRYVSFSTPSANLIPGDTNKAWDGFLRDRTAPPSTFGDFNHDAWPDLIARQASTGSLYLYPGNGTGFVPRIRIGTGWNGMSAITRLGDFDRDGNEDLIAAQSSTGALWLYPGNGSTGFKTPIRLGRGGWNGMREITPVGDLDGNGYPDILAIQRATGYLYLYPGHGTWLGSRRQVGPGWNAMSELVGLGDFNHDGRVDLAARRNATGALWLYPGKAAGGGFSAPIRIGVSGWNGMRALTGVGDFDRDGNTDLIAVQTSTGGLYLYPGHGTSLGARRLVGTGWYTSYNPLL